jgi:hypothetical protein
MKTGLKTPTTGPARFLSFSQRIDANVGSEAAQIVEMCGGHLP